MFDRFQNRRKFEKARAEAAEDQQVCAVMKDGKPTYFVVDRDAPEAVVRDQAFAILNGRSMSALERKFLDHAEARRGT